MKIFITTANINIQQAFFFPISRNTDPKKITLLLPTGAISLITGFCIIINSATHFLKINYLK